MCTVCNVFAASTCFIVRLSPQITPVFPISFSTKLTQCERAPHPLQKPVNRTTAADSTAPFTLHSALINVHTKSRNVKATIAKFTLRNTEIPAFAKTPIRSHVGRFQIVILKKDLLKPTFSAFSFSYGSQCHVIKHSER